MQESLRQALFVKARLLHFTTDFQFLVFVLYNHQLYSAYLIFFAPYLLRVLLFVYPLLLSTFLLLLVLITISPQLENSEFNTENTAKEEKLHTPPCQSCILVSVILNLGEIFKERMDEEVKDSVLEVFDSWTNVFDYNMETYYSEKGTESCAVGGCKSMTKLREWKRTLASKLYEEKQNKWRETLGGKLIVEDAGFASTGDEFSGEGMDLLWEVYEDSAKSKEKTLEKDASFLSREDSKRSLLSNSSLGKMGSRKFCGVEEEEEEENEGESPPFCCLSALRFPTRKVSFGMGKPSLVKFSKTLKGLGIFKNVHRRSKRINP